MQILYGYYGDNYVDITTNVFKKCLRDDGVLIPSGDDERCRIIGYDPYPGILKHIVIIDFHGNRNMFTHNREIFIKIDSISSQLSNQTNPKLWWNSVGKYIKDPTTRMSELHKHLNVLYGNMRDELVEQCMVLLFLDENSKVLELGGNVGRNTLIISTILSDSCNCVTLESDPNIAKALIENIQANGYGTRVEAAALSVNRLIQSGWDTMLLDSEKPIPDGWKEVSTISFNNLVNKYNITFDTLVADCEGALYQIIKDEPYILNNMRLLIIENDYHDIAHKKHIDTVFKKYGFQRIFSKEGGWGPCAEFFWEVWKKV